jgi:hypothetical protein
MPTPLDLSSLDPAQKDALILSLMAQVEALTKRDYGDSALNSCPTSHGIKCTVTVIR